MSKQTKDVSSEAATKQPRVRSPNYPSLDLKTAVGKLPALFEAMKRHPTGVEVAVSKMGYSFNSSTGKLALAAMRSYGLFENERNGSGAMVKLSTRTLDIASDYPRESSHWWEAIKKAALAPAVHQQLWSKYGSALPADDEIRRFLVRELKFNDKAVGPFIEEYKATIAFAKLEADDTIESGNGKVIAVGDFVQWTAGGVDQFEAPREVKGVSDDGKWAFVDGTQSGLPMAELTISDPPPSTGGASAQTNPFFKGDDPPPPASGIAKMQTLLDEGPVTITWPDTLNEDSFKEFVYWLEGVKRRAARKAGVKLDHVDQPPPNNPAK